MSDTYREIQPGARLAECVECYWTRTEALDREREGVLPDGCVDILFSRDAVGTAQLHVVGLMTAPRYIARRAGTFYFGVRFRPGRATALVRDAAELNDRVEPLADLWGVRGRWLLEQLEEAGSAEKMRAVMEAGLQPREIRSLDEARSERQARRLCVDLVGVPPKVLSRILRFRTAVERLGHGQPDWAQFAAACGYYDQAHMIREFQEFAGCTPGRYLQYRTGGYA